MVHEAEAGAVLVMTDMLRLCCSQWKELMTWPQEENGSPVAFTKDGKSVYVQSSLGYDTTRLLQVCLLHSVMQVQVSTPVAIVRQNSNICCFVISVHLQDASRM